MRAWKGNLVLSEDKSWLLSPRTARNEGPANVLLHHLTLGEEHIIDNVELLTCQQAHAQQDHPKMAKKRQS